jgi:alpha-ketoglutarate-dependent taurine dioxygenase
VRVSREALVRVETLAAGHPLPLLIAPAALEVNLAAWARSERAFLEEHLLRHGGLLFRGFGPASVAQFEQFARAVAGELLEYGERSSPRSALGNQIYTSTDHPPEQPILLHNEQSYTLNWPMKVFFHCLQPAAAGGQTPIADSRRIYARLPVEIVAKFVEKQVMYVRTYGAGLGLAWPEVFQTRDRAAVEDYGRRNSIEVEWMDGGERLRTRQVRPAVRPHPRTGEPVWFNHALFFHLSSLQPEVRAAMLSVLQEDEVPFNTFYGDGCPIEPSVLEEIRDAYTRETRVFTWQEGDILMLDNMLTAHGRQPFSGARKVAAAFAEPFASL